MIGRSMMISDLLPQFEILTPQVGDFLTQLGNIGPKLPYQFGQISRFGGRKWAGKRVFHDADACNPNLTSTGCCSLLIYCIVDLLDHPDRVRSPLATRIKGEQSSPPEARC